MTAKTLCTGVLVIALYLSFLAPAYAYLDPGTGSILIQALIGAIAAFLVVGKLYWYRLKSFLARLVGKAPPEMPSELENLDNEPDRD